MSSMVKRIRESQQEVLLSWFKEDRERALRLEGGLILVGMLISLVFGALLWAGVSVL